jgi:hypothetical protein
MDFMAGEMADVSASAVTFCAAVGDQWFAPKGEPSVVRAIFDFTRPFDWFSSAGQKICRLQKKSLPHALGEGSTSEYQADGV